MTEVQFVMGIMVFCCLTVGVVVTVLIMFNCGDDDG